LDSEQNVNSYIVFVSIVIGTMSELSDIQPVVTWDEVVIGR